MRHAIAVIFIAVLSACTVGVAEFAVYDQAFEAQVVEGEKVLDEVAKAERRLARQRFSRMPGIRPFDPDEARYYIDVGDPPLTGALRASLGALRDYNDALSALASGESATAARAELSSAGTALSTSLTALTGAAGLPVDLGNVAAGRIARVVPLLDVAEQAQGRRAFRAGLAAAYPDMRALMLALRDGTDDMFTVVKLGYTEVGSLGGVDGVSRDNLVRLEEFRALLAGWVILIDQSVLAMDQAVAAVAGPGDLSSLVGASVEIEKLAEAVKTARN